MRYLSPLPRAPLVVVGAMLPARPVRFPAVSAGGLMHEDVLLVSQGFDALSRAAVRVKKYEQRFDVWDRHRTPIGHIEPTHRDTGFDKLFRLVFAVIFTSGTGRNSLDFKVVDKLGNTELVLEFRARVLYVKNPVGELIGSIANTSRPAELEATFRDRAPAKGLFEKDPPAIATMNDRVDQPPYDYRLKTPDGTVFATVSNPGGRVNTLTIHDGSDPRLRALAVAFTCGLVDNRVWLQVPSLPQPT